MAQPFGHRKDVCTVVQQERGMAVAKVMNTYRLHTRFFNPVSKFSVDCGDSDGRYLPEDKRICFGYQRFQHFHCLGVYRDCPLRGVCLQRAEAVRIVFDTSVDMATVSLKAIFCDRHAFASPAACPKQEGEVCLHDRILYCVYEPLELLRSPNLHLCLVCFR